MMQIQTDDSQGNADATPSAADKVVGCTDAYRIDPNVLLDSRAPAQNSSEQPANSLLIEKEKSADTQPAQPSKPEPSGKKPKVFKLVRIVGVIALLAGVGYGVYRLFFYHPEPNGLFLSGRIEGHETDVSAKTGGKVKSVAVREGDDVQPGQLLVRMDDADLQAQLRGAVANVRQAQERLERYRQQLPILQAQLQQAELTTDQATQESQGRVTEAENTLAANRADLVQAQANLQLALVRQKRYRELFAQGAVSADLRDEYDNSAATAQAQVNSARQKVLSAEGLLTQARSTLSNTPIRTAAALQIQKQIIQARTDVGVNQHAVHNAQATQAQIQANLNYLTIKSPMAGNVITRDAEPGEVIAAGAPILTLVSLDRLYLRGFVPEGQIGKVKLGQHALVYLDSFPDRPLEATVTRIDPKASFTPENIYFKKDRVTQVFGVEVTLKNSNGLAKQGMPADGRIFVPEASHLHSFAPLPGGLGFLAP
ncbi:MAG: HlyD family efflux transporter periplasmic adaptor subunit [Chroococcidiopsidaceae cyanobacterium CP_BM_RX_35]|nr:HlyD family efflux transporter periplasmic adaptor subunit [Chroococcidiopsidaceae cyanobacterium CP_BM_RX_35]